MKAETIKSQQTARVPVDEFSDNLQALVSAFPKAEIYGLYFPQIKAVPEYQKALQTKTNLLKTSIFTSNLFFPNDPVHLSAKGHRQLANELAQQLQ